MTSKKIKGKRKDTICRILNTAAEVFSKKGFDGARMDEIAKRARVNKASIYYHVGDKETLYEQVLHDHFTSVIDQFEVVLTPAATPEKKLSRYIHQIAQVMDSNPHRAAVMLREIVTGGEHIPDIVARDLEAIIGKLSKILSEGEACGDFIHVNPFILHLMVVGAFVLYRTGKPLADKIGMLPDSLRHPDTAVSGVFAVEIERLVLNALRNGPQQPAV